MKAFLRKKIKSFFAKKGVEILRGNQFEFIKHYYETIQQNYFKPDNEEIASIIFSKDRAMQLDAFLRSYYANVINPVTVKVLYYTSSEEHNKSYDELKQLYSNKSVVFIKESNFRDQIISLLEDTFEDRVFFFVDDMVFSRGIDFKLFTKIDPLENIVTLSRGKDLSYSTVLAKKIDIPSLKKLKNGLMCFSWKEIKEFSDWTFPLGVSGYMYARKEILCMLKSISFKAPNSMEGQMQHFNIYFSNRNGVCGEYVITPCVHANLTQTEGYNPITGHFSLSELLQEWQVGKRIRFEDFHEIPVTDAETMRYTFVER